MSPETRHKSALTTIFEKYDLLRMSFAHLEQYDDNLQNLDNVEKFMYILKLGNTRIMEHIYKCWWKRKSKIYVKLEGTR